MARRNLEADDHGVWHKVAVSIRLRNGMTEWFHGESNVD
jgi:hypothetical protein